MCVLRYFIGGGEMRGKKYLLCYNILSAAVIQSVAVSISVKSVMSINILVMSGLHVVFVIYVLYLTIMNNPFHSRPRIVFPGP